MKILRVDDLIGFVLNTADWALISTGFSRKDLQSVEVFDERFNEAVNVNLSDPLQPGKKYEIHFSPNSSGIWEMKPPDNLEQVSKKANDWKMVIMIF